MPPDRSPNDAGHSRHPPLSPTAHYAPNEDRPISAYAVLVSVFGVSLGGSLAAVRLTGRELPERVGTLDTLVIGIAAHKLSRLIAKDKVTSFLRAPFTRFQDFAGHGEVEEEAYGHGLRHAIGEMLICPYCLGLWCASALTVGLVAAPRSSRLVSSVLVSHTISDFLQVVYRAAESRV
jgi:hypothetical protein